MTDLVADAEPRQALPAVALGLFDAIDAHPWAGAQLTREPWRPAVLDIYESISEQLQALDVPQRALSGSAGVLVNYILGIAGQNAANARALASSKMDRSASPPPSPHSGRSSTSLNTHPCTEPGRNCAITTTASSSSPASISSSPASRP